VGFGKRHDRGRIAINPDRFDKLITTLRTAVDNDGVLDKESTSYNDIFDSFRLALKFYSFQEVSDSIYLIIITLGRYVFSHYSFIYYLLVKAVIPPIIPSIEPIKKPPMPNKLTIDVTSIAIPHLPSLSGLL
jgi:hypothetical protein